MGDSRIHVLLSSIKPRTNVTTVSITVSIFGLPGPYLYAWPQQETIFLSRRELLYSAEIGMQVSMIRMSPAMCPLHDLTLCTVKPVSLPVHLPGNCELAIVPLRGTKRSSVNRHGRSLQYGSNRVRYRTLPRGTVKVCMAPSSTAPLLLGKRAAHQIQTEPRSEHFGTSQTHLARCKFPTRNA
jgi:hypothetical protein